MRVGSYGRLSTKELMLSNCVVGEDSWESFGLQGDQTSESQRESRLNIHSEGWCWSWSSNPLPTWCEEPAHWKRPWCCARLKQKGEVAEDEMGREHHWLNGHEFEQTLGDSGGQVCYAVYGVIKNRTRLRKWTTGAQKHKIITFTHHECRTFELDSLKHAAQTSLVAQWLRIHLVM